MYLHRLFKISQLKTKRQERMDEKMDGRTDGQHENSISPKNTD